MLFTVCIDRITFTFPFPAMGLSVAECFSHFLELLHGANGEDGIKVKKDKKGFTIGSFPLSASQTLRVRIGTSHHKGYASFDFNPASCGEQEWANLNMHMSYLLEYGYHTLLALAHVTYIEVAADFKDITWPGFITFDSGLRNSAWDPPGEQESPTCYLGRRGAGRVIRAYDKVAQLKAKKKEAPDYPLLRVEVVLRRLNRKFHELQSVDNPFKRFGICELAKATTEYQDAPWLAFIGRCLEVGSARALGEVGPKKKLYLKRLSGMQCPWWDSKEVWSQYPAALQAVAPQHLLDASFQSLPVPSDGLGD